MANNPMSPHFSLFNCHVNDAIGKALAYTEKHCNPSIHAKLVALKEEGIMALDSNKADEAFLYGLISGFVNSDLLEVAVPAPKWAVGDHCVPSGLAPQFREVYVIDSFTSGEQTSTDPNGNEFCACFPLGWEDGRDNPQLRLGAVVVHTLRPVED